MFNAAKQLGKMAIGVDADQYDAAPCCVLTSMTKNVDVAVFDTIEQVVGERFESGVKEFGLAEKGVGYVFNDKNKDRVTQAVADEVDALAKKIVAGEIAVPSK